MRRSTLFATGALVLAMSVTGYAQDNTANSSSPNSTDRNTNMTEAPGAIAQPELPAGITAKKLEGEPKQIKETLASMTEAAMTKGGFNDVVERLNDNDRNRIGQNGFADQKFDKLDGRVDQLRREWKNKYGEDFNVDDVQVVFDQRFPIVTGEVSDPATVMGHWPVSPTMNAQTASNTGSQQTAESNATVASARQNPQNVENRADQKNLDKGRDVALMQFPASHGQPAITASFVHEAVDSWKLDVPDNITGQKLHDNLLAQLTWLGEHESQWPANKDDARRMFAHHVLIAAEDVSPQANTGSSGTGNQ